MHEDLLKLEQDFARAMVRNDAEEIGRYLAADWIIIDPDGNIVERERFLDGVRSGALTHQMMESDDVRVREYGDTAVVTALTTTKAKFMGQEFSTRERATDVLVKREERWTCVLSHLTRFANK
jgi:ketosteroid isomerase-like protein